MHAHHSVEYPHWEEGGVINEVAWAVARFGVSSALYEAFLRPLLLVGLFAPAEELSAAAVLGTFYFYSQFLLVTIFLRCSTSSPCAACFFLDSVLECS